MTSSAPRSPRQDRNAPRRPRVLRRLGAAVAGDGLPDVRPVRARRRAGDGRPAFERGLARPQPHVRPRRHLDRRAVVRILQRPVPLAIGDKPIHLRGAGHPQRRPLPAAEDVLGPGPGDQILLLLDVRAHLHQHRELLVGPAEPVRRAGEAGARDRAVGRSLYPAKPVRDPVAVLYSVSHDYWHNDDPAAFVEKRLLWHALRHLGVQPDSSARRTSRRGR